MSTSVLSRRVLSVWSHAVAAVAAAVLYVAVAVAAVLVLHIVLVLLDANTGNVIVSGVSRLAGRLVGPFQGLFTPGDPKEQVAINFGLAAAVYMTAGAIVPRGIRMLGGRFVR